MTLRPSRPNILISRRNPAAGTSGLTDHGIVANHRIPLAALPIRNDT
jgi:hypothetical protein